MKSRIVRLTFIIAVAMAVAFLPAISSAAPANTGSMYGTIKDADGKPWPNITVSVQLADENKEQSGTTNDEGKFKIPDLAPGVYTVNIKQNNEVIFQIRAKVAANQDTPADINFKDPAVAEASDKLRKANAENNKFNNLKTHFDAGTNALAQAKALQLQLKQAKTPDDKSALDAKLQPLAAQAVTEFQAALPLTPEKENNHITIIEKIAESYDVAGKSEDAAKYYQQAMDAKPDSGVLNNLGNLYAKMGKMDEAKASYEKSAELDPANAANAWLNFGITLYNAQKFKDAVEPLKKATTLNPNNAQAWYLLGVTLVATMGYKQEGEKITPIMEPGTVEAYQKAIDLDPDGQWGAQAKEGIEQLKQMGLGIDTKVKTAKKKQ